MILSIHYRDNVQPDIDSVIQLYRDAGLPRPLADRDRVREIYAQSNLVVTAWENDRLIGVARSVTDWRWSCYLADLAVDPGYQGRGIGKELVSRTKKKVGDECMVLLLSVPNAMSYYPRIGMQKIDNGFILHRKV